MPSRLSIQVTENGNVVSSARQGRTHVAAAKQRHGVQVGGQALSQRRHIGGAHRFKLQVHFATAALPQAGPQRAAQGGRFCQAAQLRPRPVDRLELQPPAANGAEHRVGKNSHPGAALPRDRTAGRDDAHQHRRLQQQLA